MTFMELAKNRYSVRKFSDRPVEPEKIKAILEAGNIAPTGKNNQPQRIYVIQSAEALAKVKALCKCIYDAPVVLLFTYDIREDWKNPFEPEYRSGVEDVSIVATHIMLEAEEQGLGTCWVNYFPNTELECALGISDDEVSVLLLPIGYKADDAKPAPMHEQKKPLEDTVRYL